MKQQPVYRDNKNFAKHVTEIYSHTPLGDGNYRNEIVGTLDFNATEYEINNFIEEYKEKLIQEQMEREKKAEAERIERENLWKRKIEIVEEVDRMEKAIRIFHPDYVSILSLYDDFQKYGASLKKYTELRDDMKSILQGGETE